MSGRRRRGPPSIAAGREDRDRPARPGFASRTRRQREPPDPRRSVSGSFIRPACWDTCDQDSPPNRIVELGTGDYLSYVLLCVCAVEPSEFCNRDMCRANGKIIVLHWRGNNQFHAENRTSYEISKELRPQRCRKRGVIATNSCR